MNKTVCIYPHDFTTDFLHPLFDYICTTLGAIGIGYDTSGDDDPLELIYNEIKGADTVLFLGHGMSTCLYASIIDNVPLFNESNHTLLEGKRLFLLACNSNQFIKEFNLSNAIGFGFLPTSNDDIENRRIFHNIDISSTSIFDIECFNNAIVQILINTISKDTIKDFQLFKERLLLNTSREIVDCLINKKSLNYRIVADELYYMYKDVIFK